MKILTCLFICFLIVGCEKPSIEEFKKKHHRYSIWQKEQGLGEYDRAVGEADYISNDGTCITFWFEGQSKEQPAGIACGKVHAIRNY